MKHQNRILTVTLVTLAFAFAPVVHAGRHLDGGPTRLRNANEAPSPDGGPTRIRIAPTPRARSSAAARPNAASVNLAANEVSYAENEESSANSEIEQSVQMAAISIHAVDNVTRGKIGTFVLEMKPALMLGGMYVNFSVGGTAVAGVDYVAVVSPAYIGQSGFGVIQIQTLPDRRGSGLRQAYSVVITLEDGAGYSLGKPRSATMWIKP
jgi:hypothetical protein